MNKHEKTILLVIVKIYCTYKVFNVIITTRGSLKKDDFVPIGDILIKLVHVNSFRVHIRIIRQSIK